MNEKIDVLAALDWLVDKLPYEGEESANRFNEARAAIAELIEAAKSVEPRDCFMDEHDEVGTFGCCGEVTYHPHAADCWLSRLNAAIARVSGGAK